MKRLLIYSLTLVILLTSCTKSFLDIRSYDDLVGNEFWKDKNDVEMFIQGLYFDFRKTTTSSIYFAASGDFRTAPVYFAHPSLKKDAQAFSLLGYLKENDLAGLYRYYNASVYEYNIDFPKNDFARFDLVNDWSGFYQIIQKANITIAEINKEGGPELSEKDKKQYIAEAVFVRNICYFFLVRMYGDVPYYTEAYFDKIIGRTNMMEVLANIDKEMTEYYKDLPWTYSSASKVGSRAMRGGAIALMMHVNMWLAGFTDANRSEYYERVVTLGEELLNENQGSYSLVDIENIENVFQGRSREGLFEITQNSNYAGEVFNRELSFARLGKARLVGGGETNPVSYSYIAYDIRYMNTLFPMNEQDKRKEKWFGNPMDPSIPNNTAFFDCKKFFTEAQLAANDLVPNNNYIVFRLADCILLQAEALAELNKPAEAYDKVMIIRNRAQASSIDQGLSIEKLKDAIWYERCRELFGEGHFYYDLVRSNRVTNPSFTGKAILSSDFAKGAWTWPIPRRALENNPEMVLNTFWEN